MAIPRRALQHCINPQLVCDIVGPLLGDNGSHNLPNADDSHPLGPAHRRSLDLLERDLFPRHRLVESRQSPSGSGLQVSIHRTPGLPHLFVHHLLLPPPLRHGLHVLPDLPSGRDPNPLAPARHQAGVARLGRVGAHSSDTQGRNLQDPQVGDASPLLGTGRRAADCSAEQRSLEDGFDQARPTQQELLPQSQARQVREGEEGGEDAGDRDGGFHSVLVAVFRGEPAERVLQRLYLARADGSSGRHVAGMDQFQHESSYLRVLEQGF